MPNLYTDKHDRLYTKAEVKEMMLDLLRREGTSDVVDQFDAKDILGFYLDELKTQKHYN